MFGGYIKVGKFTKATSNPYRLIEVKWETNNEIRLNFPCSYMFVSEDVPIKVGKADTSLRSRIQNVLSGFTGTPGFNAYAMHINLAEILYSGKEIYIYNVIAPSFEEHIELIQSTKLNGYLATKIMEAETIKQLGNIPKFNAQEKGKTWGWIKESQKIFDSLPRAEDDPAPRLSHIKEIKNKIGVN